MAAGMAQPSTEQYREEMALLSDNEQGVGEKHIDVRPEVDNLREAPSSCVGYGGGDDVYDETPTSPNQQGHWEKRRSSGSSEERSGSGTAGEHQGGSRYGSVHPNAKAHESAFGSSISGSYPDPEDGGHVSSDDGMDGTKGDGDAGYDSEVRGGVPHRLTSDGVASGAGVSDDSLAVGSLSSADIEQHQYHLAEAYPSSQKESPYSQQLTQPREDSPDRFQEDEDIQGNTQGGTAFDHNQEAAREKVAREEGFLKKLVHKMPGHGHQHEATDDKPSDIQHVTSDDVQGENEDEKPGFITRLKEKLRPIHDKHHDEIDPEIYDY